MTILLTKTGDWLKAATAELVKQAEAKWGRGLLLHGHLRMAPEKDARGRTLTIFEFIWVDTARRPLAAHWMKMERPVKDTARVIAYWRARQKEDPTASVEEAVRGCSVAAEPADAK